MREGESLWSWEGEGEEDEAAAAEGGGWRRGGRGRKLQAEGGRVDTWVKISVMRRCWTAVSCVE